VTFSGSGFGPRWGKKFWTGNAVDEASFLVAEPSSSLCLQKAVSARVPFSKLAWLWPLTIAALIFLASTRSHVAGPAVKGSDKVAHFSVYGLLGTLIVRSGRGQRAAIVALLLTSAYGASDEWHQSFTPGRSVEFGDWLADTLGGALAIGLYTFWPRYRAVLERPLFGRERRVENTPSVANVFRS
jgi:VanZ family protein